MASFPGSVKSFASRSNGQSIDASHVNDLQDEVNAIEDGLRNGTAPLNSSRSTFAGLSVTGNSTLASSITVGTLPYIFPAAGGSSGTVLMVDSTSGSTMTLKWGTVAGVEAPPRVRLTHSARLDLGSTSFVGLNWDTEVYDSDGMHSTATNSSRITFAHSTGIYHVGACVTVNDDGDEFFNILIQMNDSSRVVQQTASVQGQHIQSICVSADVRVASTADFVTVKVAQQSLGSSASIYAESTGTPIGFWAHRVSS